MAQNCKFSRFVILAVVICGLLTSCGSSVSTTTVEKVDNAIQSGNEETGQSVEGIDWSPEGFNVWESDNRLAYRWLEKTEFKCDYSDSPCWGLEVITSQTCEGDLYGSVALLDKDGVQLGSTGDQLGYLQKGRVGQLVFNSVEGDATKVDLSELRCGYFSTEKADNDSQSEAEENWYPEGFSAWQSDPNVAWKWLSKSEFKCRGEGSSKCWAILVVSRQNCVDDLYGEVAALDGNSKQVGTGAESVSGVQANRPIRIIFDQFNVTGWNTAKNVELVSLKCRLG